MPEITSGIKLTADATGVTAASQKVVESQGAVQESFGKTRDAMRANNEESARFVARLKEEAETLGKSKIEIDAYRASRMNLTEEQRASVTASLQAKLAQEQHAESMQRATVIGKGLGTAVGLAASALIAYGTAQAVMVKGAITEAAEVNNLSQSLGMSTEALSAHRYQMSLSGVTGGAFESSMRTLANRVQEAQLGVGKGAQVFGVLGGELQKAAQSGAPLEKILPLLADRMADYKDGTLKTALATDLMSGSGAKLIPMLNQGSEGFRAAAKEAEDYRRVIGPDFARNADAFETNLTRLSAAFKAHGYAIANEALPPLNRFLDRLTIFAKTDGDNGGVLGAGVIKKLLAASNDKNVEELDWDRRYQQQNDRIRQMFGGDAPAVPNGGGKRSDFDTIQAQMVRGEAAMEARLASTDKLTQAERRLAEIDALMEHGVIKISDAQYAEIAASTERTAAMERSIAARDRDKKAVEEATRAYNAGVDQQFRSIQASSDQNKKLQEHNLEIGKTKAQIDLLRAARAEETLAIAQENLALVTMHDASEAELEIAEQRVRTAEDLVRLLREGAVLEANAEAAKKAAEEWKRTADNIERSLIDALMRGFDKGKSFMQNFKDGLVNAFKTAILTPLIKPIVAPVAGFLSGAVQGIGESLFGGGGGGGFGNALSLGSSAYQMASGNSFLGGLFGGGGGLTGSAMSGEIAALTGSGVSIGGALGTGASAGLGMLGPIGLGIGAVALLGGLFGGGGGPKPGEVFLGNDQGGAAGRFNIGNNNLPGDQGANEALLNSLSADLNDPSKYDQGVLASLLGQSTHFQGDGLTAEQGFQRVLAAIAPAAQAAQQKKAAQQQADTQAFLAKLGGGSGLMQSLQGYADSMQVSEYLAPMDRLAGAKALFQDSLTGARGGDADAIQALGGRASSLLQIGRDVYASGPEFQQLMKDVNREFGAVLADSQKKQSDLLAETPIAIKEASMAQVEAIQKQTAELVARFDALSADFNRFARAAAA